MVLALEPTNAQVVSLGNPYEWLHGRARKLSDLSDLERTDESLTGQKSLLFPTAHGYAHIAVLGCRPSDALSRHLLSVLGKALPMCVTPARVTASLCSDLLADQRAFDELTDALSSRRPVYLAPYVETPELELLADALEQRGFEVLERPRWSELVRRWTSKAAIDRELYRREEVIVASRPRAWEAADAEDLLRVLRSVANEGVERVVVKTAMSAGGAGVFFAHVPEVLASGRTDQVFSTRGVNAKHVAPPFLVEEEITWTFSPSIDVDVRPHGVVDLVGWGFQRLYDRRYYAGFSASSDALSTLWFRKALDIATRIAAGFAERGFLGPINCDFVVTPEDRVVLIETNVRRSALTDGHGAARLLSAGGALVPGLQSRHSSVSFADYVECRVSAEPTEVLQMVESVGRGLVAMTADAGLSVATRPEHRWGSLMAVGGSPQESERRLNEVAGALMGLSPEAAALELGNP